MIYKVLSTQAVKSCHNSTAQVALPLCFQFLCFIPVATPTGHLPLSVSQYRSKVLAIFLIQLLQSLKPDGQLSPLKTDQIHLVIQQFLQRVWDSTQQLYTFDVFPKYDRTHQGILFFIFWYFIYSGASSAHITSFSGNIQKSLPPSQSMIISKIPGPLGFPIQAHCVTSARHLLHIASVA